MEKHFATTKTGYILGLHRIPRSKKAATNNATKPVVLLQHGLATSSDCWILSGRRSALGSLSYTHDRHLPLDSICFHHARDFIRFSRLCDRKTLTLINTHKRALKARIYFRKKKTSKLFKDALRLLWF